MGPVERNSDFSHSVVCKAAYYREVCSLLKENGFVDSFVILDDIVQDKWLVTINTAPLTYYCDSEEDFEAFSDYIAETGIGEVNVVERYFDGELLCSVSVPEEKTVEEYFDISLQIFNDTGRGVDYCSPESFTESALYSVDVFNAVDGDANEDDDVNMGDVVSIIQHIGNRDQYGLSPQGIFNADVDSDGLTGMEAVAIQIKLAEEGMPE